MTLSTPRPAKPLFETLVLVLLTSLTTLGAVYMVMTERASWLEGVSFVTGAVCVWLTVKENVWNFPIGILNVMTFSVVFFRAGLYADAGLQVVYFFLGVAGWYLWLYGGERHSQLRVSSVTTREWVFVSMLTAVATLVLWRTLHYVGGSSSFWDALTTSISLAAQWWTNKKRLESWIGWILVDIIYVPLYIYKDLYLTAALYAVFLCMAVMGYRHWRASHRASELARIAPTSEGVA